VELVVQNQVVLLSFVLRVLGPMVSLVCYPFQQVLPRMEVLVESFYRRAVPLVVLQVQLNYPQVLAMQHQAVKLPLRLEHLHMQAGLVDLPN
jgi:hypothetical protein